MYFFIKYILKRMKYNGGWCNGSEMRRATLDGVANKTNEDRGVREWANRSCRNYRVPDKLSPLTI